MTAKHLDQNNDQRSNVDELFDPENAEHSVVVDLGGGVYVGVEPVAFRIRNPIEPILSEQ